MDYMRQLRRMVGKFPLVMVGAGVLVLDAQRRLLLLRRTDNECWGIPGGALEPGETLEVTARRETLEETGLHLPSLELFGVFSGPEFYYQYPNGDQVHNVSIIYWAWDVYGEIRLNAEEHSAWQYFDLEAMPIEISPPVIPILRRLVETR